MGWVEWCVHWTKGRIRTTSVWLFCVSGHTSLMRLDLDSLSRNATLELVYWFHSRTPYAFSHSKSRSWSPWDVLRFQNWLERWHRWRLRPLRRGKLDSNQSIVRPINVQWSLLSVCIDSEYSSIYFEFGTLFDLSLKRRDLPSSVCFGQSPCISHAQVL